MVYIASGGFRYFAVYYFIASKDVSKALFLLYAIIGELQSSANRWKSSVVGCDEWNPIACYIFGIRFE